MLESTPRPLPPAAAAKAKADAASPVVASSSCCWHRHQKSDLPKLIICHHRRGKRGKSGHMVCRKRFLRQTSFLAQLKVQTPPPPLPPLQHSPDFHT
jgi:hypothetical protein